jgi:hypothetical protein
MSEQAAVATAALPSPDTSARDIPCPLCGYNLRGLIEPRCPECGYAFDWPDVIDPTRQPHPYSFEHHPERNVRSFVRTYLAGLLPRRFFRRLRPTHPIHGRRLVLYWFLTTAPLLLSLLAILGPPYVQVVREQLESKVYTRQYFLANLSDPTIKQIVTQYGSVDAYLRTWPSPYWGIWTRTTFLSRIPLDRGSLNAIAVLLAWPWLTLATLMVFRASMRRAKVKPRHVLRCTIYACDWTAWLGGAALVVFTTPFAEQWLPIFYPRAAVPILAAALFAAYTTYRLGSAYSLYLAFDRPYATALASQLITLLLVTVVFVIASGS